MRRVIVLVVLATACGRATKRPALTLTPGEAITVSSDHDRVEVAFAPALAVGSTGMLVAWAAERRDEELGDHVIVRALSREAALVADPIELGRGYAPGAVVGPDAYVVAWRPTGETGASFAFAKIGHDAKLAMPPVLAGDVPTAGTPTMTVGNGIVAASCADDYDHLIVARDPFGAPRLEHFRPRAECDDVVAASADNLAFAAVATQEFRHTEVVALAEPTTASKALLDGHCDVVESGSELAFVCLNEPDAHAANIQRVDQKPKRVDVDFGGRVHVLRAVALDGAILLAWTVETSDGFALRAAVVNADGSARTPVVELSPEPVVPRFDLEGDGADGWVAYVTELQVDASRYRHDVVLVPVRVTGI